VSAGRAIARRALRDSRTRTISFAFLFALVAYANVAGYRSAYPTLADRLKLSASFGSNGAVRLFYGEPFDLLTPGGYAAWRVAGVASILAGAYGLLGAVRALRAEEETGRWELILVGIAGRRRAYLAVAAAIVGGIATLWLATLLGLVAARLPLVESAYLALAIVTPALVFAGVGAMASQLAGTRRLAIELASGVLALAFLLRVVADTSSGLAWLRWLTPLGWSEELRPFTGSRPLALVLPLAASLALLGGAGLIASRRDVGSSLLPARDSAPPRTRLLGSPGALAARSEAISLAVWVLASGFFALIVGIISTSVAAAGISSSVQRQLREVAAVAITTPTGYIGFSFLLLTLVVSLFCCSQIAAARHEEADERLETVLALPVARHRWLAERLSLAVAGAVAISLVAGALGWAGAAAQSAGVELPEMLEAGANCLPVALLFLSLAALAYALVPRAAVGVAYGLVAASFLWQLFGGVVHAPRWALELSPFEHLGLVPAQPFRATAAIVMLSIAAAGAAAAMWAFERRDLAAS
jgi:polyether ionophore transport system permease protein